MKGMTKCQRNQLFIDFIKDEYPDFFEQLLREFRQMLKETR